MKIVFKTSEIKSLFGVVSSCIVEEKLGSIHSMFIKKIASDKVYVRAMDNKHVFEKNINAIKIDDDFVQSYIPFFEINKFVSKFKNDETNFTFKENFVLRVSSGKSYCQVSLKNAEESDVVVNMLESNFNEPISLKKEVIFNVKSKLVGLVASDNTRPVLNGICMDIFENKVYFASSDGKKLAVYDTQIDITNENKKVIIPTEAVNSFCSVTNTDNVDLYYNDKYIKFVSGDTKYYSTLINGEYPDYRKILNSTSNNSIEVSVNKVKLSDALSFVNVNFEVNKKCDLKISNGKFSLDFNNNESFEEFDIDSDKEFAVSINSQFLEKMVKPLDSENIVFKFNTAESPILIESDSIKMMLMPLRPR